MTRLLGLSLLAVALMLAVRAAADDPVAPAQKEEPTLKKKDRKERPQEELKEDPEPLLKKKDKKAPKEDDPEDKKDPKKKKPLPEIKPLPKDEGPSGTDPAELVSRIKKSLAATEERLEKKDPGDETRKLQDQIVKDLDELIKQQDDDPSGGGGGGGGASSGKSGRSGRKSSANSGGTGGSGKNSAGSNANSGKNQAGKDKADKDKTASKSPQGGGKDKQTAQGSGGQKGKPGEDAKKNTIADLFKDVWGHLPQTKRVEMDAYSRERFMRRYEDVLRQYYRTIAEQNRRKEGD